MSWNNIIIITLLKFSGFYFNCNGVIMHIPSLVWLFILSQQIKCHVLNLEFPEGILLFLIYVEHNYHV